MKNKPRNWYVATVMAPGPRLGGALEAYRGWQPCVEWCVATFGDMWSPDNPSRWRFISEGVFEFEREQDRTCFLLKWA